MKKYIMRLKLLTLSAISIVLLMNCSRPNGNTSNVNQRPSSTDTINSWITKADSTILLQKQTPSFFNTQSNSFQTITVDSTISYQTIEGFGYALTGGSAYVINKLDVSTKNNLLHELFGHDANSIGVSYLRISIGSSDLNATVFSYDDVPNDTTLSHFSLSKDETDLIPLLKQIIAINPDIRILATPWSAPVWMKDNNSSAGGSLLPKYYNVYANYFVKYIQSMKAEEGITINGITPQNEPLNDGNNPSMVVTAEEERDFIKNNLGPAFQSNNISTKIIVYDHNCDKPDYPITILNDADAAKFVDGSAFHLYAGDISALTTVHNTYPNKNVYFTEQWTGANESFSSNLKEHIKNIIIGTMTNWASVALEWNLASDADFEPHTNGGCNLCKGALTINGGVIRNVSYYIIAHAAKFVPRGSVRIASTHINGLSNVAFKTPEGKKVLIALNDGSSAASFNIQYQNKSAVVTLPPNTAATYVW